MSWLFSQALVAGFLEATSSAGEPSAPSSGNHTQQVYLSPDRTTVISRLSRFGMTCRPLTVERGEELLTLFRAAFPVKTSQLQGRATGLMASGQECGERWRGSWVKYDLDSSSWRTHQHSLLGGLAEYLETWPRWGSMRSGECWERKPLEQFIAESEFGLSLPTPCKNEFAGTGKKRFRGSPHFRGAKTAEALRTCETDKTYSHPQFIEEIMGWPIGWSAIAPLATDKFQEWLQRHSQALPINPLHLASSQKHTFGN